MASGANLLMLAGKSELIQAVCFLMQKHAFATNADLPESVK
jgi:hypothetical protein